MRLVFNVFNIFLFIVLLKYYNVVGLDRVITSCIFGWKSSFDYLESNFDWRVLKRGYLQVRASIVLCWTLDLYCNGENNSAHFTCLYFIGKTSWYCCNKSQNFCITCSSSWFSSNTIATFVDGEYCLALKNIDLETIELVSFAYVLFWPP